MARKCKVGIEYFSHDVDMAQDKKIKILKAKHGLVGYALFLRLLEELYREEGYYLKIDEDFNILFSDDNNLDYNAYILILNDCIEKGLFDKDKFEEHSILTSKRIQENYIAATDRRKEVEFIDEYLLVDAKSIYSEKVNVIINSLNVDINSLNDCKSTQSKVKESKEKKKKESSASDEAQSFFDECWKLYPNKKGKGQIKDKAKKEAYKLGEEFKMCIERYIKSKPDWQQFQNGSTFWNSGYIDYLNSNIQEDNFKNTSGETRLGIPPCESILPERDDDPWF